MSANGVVKGARKRLLWLVALILGFVALIGGGALNGIVGASFVPQLALDLQGGTQIILTPQLTTTHKTVSEETLNQAVAIIRDRVNASGVSEAQVTTSGNSNIVVSIPGKPDDNTLELIKASAKLEFRAVLAASAGSSSSVGGANGATPSASATPASAPIATSAAAPDPSNPSDLNYVSKALQSEYEALDCSTAKKKPGVSADPTKPLVTCSTDKTEKYILSKVEIDGTDISDASSGTVTTSTGASTNEWAVNLSFNPAGSEKFSKTTSRLYPLSSPLNRFAITLDDLVITAPQTNAVISNGSAQITGNFTSVSAKTLSDQLKYGSLPIGFNVQSQDNISATLGSEQLSNGLLAGLIGLILVVIYSVFQYRGLAIVTIGSLVVAAVLTYLLIALLSWRQGYRLSLSGVAGLIVAIGITADSFIVFFERVRDELRDGRPLSAAVEAGWSRAIRTIIVSDGVSLLAASTLYVLTVGSVRGFAFTLGLTTIVDLAVVVLFTRPMLQILATLKFFASGHPWSGFDAKALGAVEYVGRGQFRARDEAASTKLRKSSREAERRQTIAERKAAEIAENNEKAGK